MSKGNIHKKCHPLVPKFSKGRGHISLGKRKKIPFYNVLGSLPSDSSLVFFLSSNSKTVQVVQHVSYYILDKNRHLQWPQKKGQTYDMTN